MLADVRSAKYVDGCLRLNCAAQLKILKDGEESD